MHTKARLFSPLGRTAFDNILGNLTRLSSTNHSLLCCLVALLGLGNTLTCGVHGCIPAKRQLINLCLQSLDATRCPGTLLIQGRQLCNDARRLFRVEELGVDVIELSNDISRSNGLAFLYVPRDETPGNLRFDVLRAVHCTKDRNGTVAGDGLLPRDENQPEGNGCNEEDQDDRNTPATLWRLDEFNALVTSWRRVRLHHHRDDLSARTRAVRKGKSSRNALLS